MMHRYTYDGPVTEFGKCIDNHWKAATYAASISKAKSNLTYQFKMQYGKSRNTKIDLPGKIILDERKGSDDGHQVRAKLV